jgi:hypothetical protein
MDGTCTGCFLFDLPFALENDRLNQLSFAQFASCSCSSIQVLRKYIYDQLIEIPFRCMPKSKNEDVTEAGFRPRLAEVTIQPIRTIRVKIIKATSNFNFANHRQYATPLSPLLFPGCRHHELSQDAPLAVCKPGKLLFDSPRTPATLLRRFIPPPGIFRKTVMIFLRNKVSISRWVIELAERRHGTALDFTLQFDLIRMANG